MATYFYIHPFKPQYFFPQGFKKHKVFRSFYQPYSLFGRTSWALFQNLGLYRQCFIKKNIEAFIPEQTIRKILNCKDPMAFNTGTVGAEQKITVLGWNGRDYFFIKYAQSSTARRNVSNENFVLQQLSDLDFVPKVRSFFQDKEQVLVETEVFHGKRLSETKLDEIILERLLILAKLTVETCRDYKTSVKTTFAHGDFCPWNMMQENKKISIFDWEMAGTYPLGYDLFTFLFQTKILLQPERATIDIIDENEIIINKFFNHFGINDWKPYLKAFAEIKIALEKEKRADNLLISYQKLAKDAEKV